MAQNRIERIEAIIAKLIDDESPEIAEAYGEFCDANGYQRIYSMDEFDELMEDKTPWEVARCAFFGDFNPTYDWFWFNGYANLESGAYLSDTPMDASELAEYAVDHDKDFGIGEIREVLNSDGMPDVA